MSIKDTSPKANPPRALQRGALLGEFELRHGLGGGVISAGIVDLALDHEPEGGLD